MLLEQTVTCTLFTSFFLGQRPKAKTTVGVNQHNSEALPLVSHRPPRPQAPYPLPNARPQIGVGTFLGMYLSEHLHAKRTEYVCVRVRVRVGVCVRVSSSYQDVKLLITSHPAPHYYTTPSLTLALTLAPTLTRPLTPTPDLQPEIS